jgi:hypothetical protein
MRPVTMVFLCIAGALLNNAFTVVAWKMNIPLFLDTVLTVTLTMTGGLFWGVLTGALTNLIYNTLFYWGWEHYLFALCNMATAVVTWLFMRFFSRELGLGAGVSRTDLSSPHKSDRFETVADRVIVLTLLSFGLCVSMSVLGGLISALIQIFNPGYPKGPLVSVAVSDDRLPLILKEVISRFPINIIDRLITAFAGYGVAAVLQVIREKLRVKSVVVRGNGGNANEQLQKSNEQREDGPTEKAAG